MDDETSKRGLGEGSQLSSGMDKTSKRRLGEGSQHQSQSPRLAESKSKEKCEKCRTKEEKSKELLEMHNKKMEDEVNENKNRRNSRLGRIFKMNDKIIGGKKTVLCTYLAVRKTKKATEDCCKNLSKSPEWVRCSDGSVDQGF